MHPLCISEYIVSKKKRGPIILVTLTAHHTPTLVLYIMAPRLLFWDYVPTRICYFENLRNGLSKTTLCQ